MLGSGICGGASSMAVVIAGRAVQGIGGAGVNVLSELIVCDLVPLRERGSILGIVFGASALGPAVGPVIVCPLSHSFFFLEMSPNKVIRVASSSSSPPGGGSFTLTSPS